MADTASLDQRPLTLEDLTAYFAAGSKPRSAFRVGAEHEKFGFYLGSHAPVPYYGDKGVHALLVGLQRFGWKPVMEGDVIIGLERNGANVSLEPGGQFELSGAPLKTMHDICEETGGHLDEVKAVADELGLGFLGVGFSPEWKREDVPVMPKGRYVIMREYMPKVGNLGLDMMLRTCTVQANLDFESEADMVAKFRMSLALQPIATALFANSPFTEGKPNGFLSARANVWTDTDPNRTGLLSFVFEDGFGFERYAQYMLDVPMYFAKRGDRYIDLAGRSFRDFIDGKIEEVGGERATIKDWADHATTAFPEVRLKTYLEMRGADAGPWSRLCALPALWTGVFYDDAALAAAWDLAKDWTVEDREGLRRDVPRLGLKARVAGRSVQDVARDFVAIAKSGLKNRAQLNGGFLDETIYLGELEEIADSGITPAERLLEKFHGQWQGDIGKLFDEGAY
ncbi:glutamate--cysteine ligase [Caulobacter flavus]|uniref:Glutamate--cysteine ligase n=1 Tax=Caulobacter flavus TaxID=1679497 RepID=A0A2N5CR86_9CAUL|nr:glutamate--cysteine ligase [Caulobacter flavus]AYV46104.1 glutamate--cysteine ligase [Caulobacter flavus]PLR11243.1 glutamate--cysteine ligase [Caulobacter flavus]